MAQEQFTEALNEFVRQRRGEGLVVAKVTEVNLNELLIDCKDGDDNEYLDVRLNATTGQTGIIAVPKVYSTVIILELGNSKHDYLMIHAGEIDKAILHVHQNTELQIDESEIRLGNIEVEQAVRGNQLNTNLDNLFNQIDTLLSNFQTFLSTQSGVSASGPLAPLNAGYVTLNGQIATVKGQLNAIKMQLDEHLSDRVKIGK